MDSKQLETKLDQQVEAHMKRTLPFDIAYAFISGLFIGFWGAFIFGTQCENYFINKCVAYSVLPIRFALAYFGVGTAIFWTSFKALRAWRRRTKWFG